MIIPLFNSSEAFLAFENLELALFKVLSKIFSLKYLFTSEVTAHDLLIFAFFIMLVLFVIGQNFLATFIETFDLKFL